MQFLVLGNFEVLLFWSWKVLKNNAGLSVQTLVCLSVCLSQLYINIHIENIIVIITRYLQLRGCESFAVYHFFVIVSC